MLSRFETGACYVIMTPRVSKIENKLYFRIRQEFRETLIRARQPAPAKLFQIRDVAVINANESEIRIASESFRVQVCYVTATDDGDVHLALQTARGGDFDSMC